MVVEDRFAERARPPPERRRLELVHAVPAQPLLEWEHGLEALAAPNTRRAANVAFRHVPRTPAFAVALQTHPARDPERRVGVELAQQPVEVLRAEGNVGVELDDEIRAPSERAEPGVERDDVATALATLVERAAAPRSRDQPDPFVSSGEHAGECRRAVRRSVVDDDPLGRQDLLVDDRRGEPPQVVELVPRRRDQGVAGHATTLARRSRIRY